ncbi:C25 family cysteine peptidase [Candidatus Marinimicrobia bacterium]|nr:C25 family cysteine peptidase [Candidatus Neomarinimicrobiota bacterium]
MFILCCSLLFSEVQINVIESNDDHVIIEYIVNDFTVNLVSYENEVYNEIILNDEPRFIEQNKPQLPHINRSFIIPDFSSISVEVLSSNFSEYRNMNILPSKGNIKRNIDINDVPYIKGDTYNKNTFFPASLYNINDPYILRDFRGQVVQLNPFQFNPVSKVMKVYNKVILKLTFDGTNTQNQFYRTLTSQKKITKDYSYMYAERFLNYTHDYRYTPVSEEGEMLVICYDDFCDEMSDFVDWKNQKGIKTTLVPKSTAGNSASAIKDYIDNFYDNNDLVYVLFVGDKDQIPTFTVGSGMSSGECDICYGYLSGNDSYPEIFVGRFSAQNSSHVNTAVERTINYEKYPDTGGNWYRKGLMIASNEGQGNGHDGGEGDWQHAQNMRDDLMDYYYTSVGEMYEGSQGGQDSNGNPSDSMVRNSINDGLGIIHYTGHGDTDVWVTSNFNTGDVNQLTNANELPFVCTVGCKSGDFGDGTCLGEEFLRATNNGSPTGAIATFMSTIYQGWAPPMEAQDEMVDILVENYSNNRKYSFGGISWNGCLKMNDEYGSSGYDETDHWTLIGDPSVELRTNTPSNLNVSHSDSMEASEPALEITVSGNNDHVVGALSYEGTYLGSCYLDGSNSCVIVSDEDLSNFTEVTLTVTGYNKSPYITQITMGSACSGYSYGDINADSTINVSDVVVSVGIVLGTLSADECQMEFGDINRDGTINVSDIVLLVGLILG